jgi:hypothetical protein
LCFLRLTIPTIGKGLDADSEGYDRITVIGPFNCLPYPMGLSGRRLCFQANGLLHTSPAHLVEGVSPWASRSGGDSYLESQPLGTSILRYNGRLT